MALAPRIEIRQTQTLVMTPQLQQAIKLLQMSNLELAEYLAAEVEKNPLLELAPPPRRPPGPGRRGEGDGGFLETIAAEVTLHEHLHAQIGAMRAPPAAIEAALILADELEDDGYLRVPLAEVAARHRLTAGARRRGPPPGPGLRAGRRRRAQPHRMPGAAASRARPSRPGDGGAARATCRWPPAASSPSCARSAASTPRTSPTCSPRCARSTRSPACASPGRGSR